MRVGAGVRVRTYCARVRAFVCLLGREVKKWGGKRKKVGEGAKRVGDEEREGVDREIKVRQGVKNEGRANRKSVHAVRKGECRENKG